MKYILYSLAGVLSFLFAPAQHGTTNEPAGIRTTDQHVAIVMPSLHSQPAFLLRHNGPVTGFADSKRVYSGSVKNHHLHGPWQSWYTGGQVLDSGTLRQGVPHGEWKHWDSAGQLIAVRHYDAGKLQRVREEIRLHHPKRSFYSLAGLYQKNKQAASRYLSAAGSFSFSPGDKMSLQQLVEGNSYGKQYRPVFIECLHHGLYMNFFSNGQLKDSGYYKDGLPDGVWIHKGPDQNTWRGAYKNGMKTHEWKQYNKEGRLLLIVFYSKRGEEEDRKMIKANR